MSPGVGAGSAMAAGVLESAAALPLVASTGAGGVVDTPSPLTAAVQAEDQPAGQPEGKAAEREPAGNDGGLESPEQGPACGLPALPELAGHPAAMPPVCQAARPWLQGLRRPPRLG